MLLPLEAYPKKLDKTAHVKAAALIKRIEMACDENQFESPELSELKGLTGKSTLTAEQYFEISGTMSYEEAATLAFCPEVKAIAGLNFEQFCEICMFVKDRLISKDFEYWYQLFITHARNSNAGDLVFHPPQEWINRLITAGEVPKTTTRQNFSPTPAQLAKEAWIRDAILL